MAIFEHPGALAGPPVDWDGVRRVLVIRPDNLGDVLMTGPALSALRRAVPPARIELLASPAGAAAAPLLPWLDDVLVESVSWQRFGADPAAGNGSDDAELVRELARRRYDVALVLTSFSQSPWPAGYVCQLAGVPVRAGMSKEFGGSVLTHWVPSPPDELHQVDRALHLLARLGVADTGTALEVTVPRAAEAAARVALGPAARRPYAVLLPGASCSARRYPVQRYQAVARLLADSGIAVVAVGTAKEQALVERAVNGVPGGLALAGVLDVPALAASMAGARVVVTNNSGGAHLADAVRAPVVVLFAGTEQVEQFRPRSTPAAVLTVPTSCAPCRQLSCPFGLPCLDLPPETVAAVALRLAESTAP